MKIPSWVREVKPEEAPPQFVKFIEAIGMTSTLSLAESLGGEYVYIPKLDALIKAARDEHLWADFQKGVEAKVLAHRYDLSVVQVYEIIKQRKAPGISLLDALAE